MPTRCWTSGEPGRTAGAARGRRRPSAWTKSNSHASWGVGPNHARAAPCPFHPRRRPRASRGKRRARRTPRAALDPSRHHGRALRAELTFGPDIAALRRASGLFFDVHLMLDEPHRYVEPFAGQPHQRSRRTPGHPAPCWRASANWAARTASCSIPARPQAADEALSTAWTSSSG